MRLDSLIHSVLFLEADEEAIQLDFDYGNTKNDPHPVVFYMGKYVHPVTKNTLWGGINLNYLDDREVQMLRKGIKLSKIHTGMSLYDAYHKLINTLKKHFGYNGAMNTKEFTKKAYRTYNERYIKGKRRGSLALLDYTNEDERLASREAEIDGKTWTGLDPNEQAKYIEDVLVKQAEEAEAADELKAVTPPAPTPQPARAPITPTPAPPMGQQPRTQVERPSPTAAPKNPVDQSKLHQALEPEPEE